jgi:predicted phosphodiesterase
VKRPPLPTPRQERDSPDASFPDARKQAYDPFRVDQAGHWLLLPDPHVPDHDRVTLELAVKEGKRRKLAGLIFTGDTLDTHDLSEHEKDPDAPPFPEELRIGEQLVAWFRGQFPKIPFVFKEGNHEERMQRFIHKRAKELRGLRGLSIAEQLRLDNYGAEWVGEKRVIELGRLSVIHGHEYHGSGGQNPAKWLHAKAHSVAICGHFHRTSNFRDRNIRGKPESAWSMGCACYLHPKWMPLNSWNNGFAVVEVARDGGFQVSNLAVFEGKLV